jgi:hypothetical protein
MVLWKVDQKGIILKKKHFMKSHAVLILLFTVVVSCNSRPSNFETGDPSGNQPAVVAALNASTISQVREVSQKLIKKGSLRFEVASVVRTDRQLDSIINSFEGYVQENNVNTVGSDPSRQLIARIPSDKFDDFVSSVEKISERIIEKNLTIDDVTDQFVDLEARLKTKYALEVRYRELLRKAQSVEDMLNVESRIEQVRSEIESMEARRRSMGNRIAYGTLQIVYYQPTPYAGEPGYFSKVAEGLSEGWKNLLAISIVLVYLWPFIIFFTIAVWLAFRYRKRSVPTP